MFWLPKRGELQAALVFRVGRSDERLARTGISHVVEHLSIQGAGSRHHTRNGFVDHQRTVLWCSGDADEVGSFLTDVSASIRQLPLDRLEAERRVLAVEASSRPSSVVGSLLAYRFGPVGLGLAGYDEFGVRTVQPDDLTEWVSSKFVRENAALWIWGTPPNDLRLDLPSGERSELPMCLPPTVATPTYVETGSRMVALTMLVPRTRVAMSLGRIGSRRLQDRLRGDLGVSYDVAVDLLPVDERTGHLSFAADSLAEDAGRVAAEMLDALDGLAADGPSPAEMALDIETLLRSYAADGAEVRWLDSYVIGHLTHDEEPLTPAKAVAELRAAPPEQLAAVMATALESALISLPRGAERPTWRFVPPADWSTSRVEGRRHASAAGNAQALIVGDDGVTMVLAEPDRVATVRFAECEALLQWDDGSRALHGRDGFIVRVHPWAWSAGADAVAAIDAAVDESVVVPMGPGAGPPAPAAVPTAAPAGRWRRLIGSPVTVGIVAVVVLLVALLSLVLVFTEPQPDVGSAHGVPLAALPITDGLIDCGSRSAIGVVLHGAGVSVTGPYRGPIVDACQSEAGVDVAAGGGLLVFDVAAVAGLAFMRRRMRRRDGVPAVQLAG